MYVKLVSSSITLETLQKLDFLKQNVPSLLYQLFNPDFYVKAIT